LSDSSSERSNPRIAASRSWYFRTRSFELSKAALREQPGYVERVVGAEPGTITPQIQGQVWSETDGIELLSKSAPPQSILLEPRQRPDIVCPLHADLRHEGELLGARTSRESLPQPRQDLLQNWRECCSRETHVAKTSPGSPAPTTSISPAISTASNHGFEQTGKLHRGVPRRLITFPYHPDWELVTATISSGHCELFGACVDEDGSRTGRRLTPVHEFSPLHGGNRKQGDWFLYYPNSCSSGIRTCCREHAAAALAGAHTTSSVYYPRTSFSSTRIRRSRAAAYRETAIGRRDRQAHGRAGARSTSAAKRSRPYIADGRRDDALPRAHQARLSGTLEFWVPAAIEDTARSSPRSQPTEILRSTRTTPTGSVRFAATI